MQRISTLDAVVETCQQMNVDQELCIYHAMSAIIHFSTYSWSLVIGRLLVDMKAIRYLCMPDALNSFENKSLW